MMKKLFIGVAIAMISLFATSCSCSETGNNVPIIWNVDASASGAGKVEVTFPTGGLNVAGDAKVNVASSNDSTKVMNGICLSEALASNDAKTVAFAKNVEAQLNDTTVFNVVVLEGTWNVDITGYAKQPDTGIYIVIDQHWPKE